MRTTTETQNPHFAEKVFKITFELSRLMANTGGPKQKKHLTLTTQMTCFTERSYEQTH